MKQDCYLSPLKLALGLLVFVLLALLLCGCGSLMRLEYQHPQYGGGAVEFALPKKEGYAK